MDTRSELEILVAARRILKERKRWIQGKFFSVTPGLPTSMWHSEFFDKEGNLPDVEGCCALGAVKLACVDPEMWGKAPPDRRPSPGLERNVDRLLCAAITRLHPDSDREIVGFNDFEAQSREQVLAVFDEAIRGLGGKVEEVIDV